MSSGPTETAPAARSFVRDAGLTVASRFLLAAVILATDVVLARTLGPDGKGRFTLVVVLAQLGAIAVSLGLDRAIGYTSAQGRGVARSALGNGVVWTLAVGIAAGAVLLLVAAAVGIPSLGLPEVIFAAIALPLELGFSFWLLALLGRQQVVGYNAARLLRRAMLLGGLVLLAAVGLNVRAALALNALGLVTAIALATIYLARAGATPGRPDRTLLGQQLRYGVRSWPGELADRFQFRLDAFVVNAVTGVVATGVYSVAASGAEALWYIPAALGAVLFGRAAAAGHAAAPLTSRLTRATLALGLALAIPAAFLAPFLIEALYGPAFGPAVRALQLLLPGVVAYGVAAILSQYLLATGAPGRSTFARLAGLAVNVAANLVLVPLAGIDGAAIASSISYTVTAAVMLWLYLGATGRGLAETLLLRRADLAAVGTAFRAGRGASERGAGG